MKVIIDIGVSLLLDYDELPKDIKKKFRKQITFLKENPKHKSLNIHQIEGTGYWEFYVDVGYRCIFEKEGNVYRLLFVGTHKLIDRA